MEKETKKVKTGNESSVIIIILALLLIIVLAIVGAIVLKDNKGIATFDGGKVTKAEYRVYYTMFADYLKYYGYSAEEIPTEIAVKAATDKMILLDAKAAGVQLSAEDKEEVDNIFKDQSYVEYFQSSGFNIDELKKIYYNDYIIAAYIEKLATETSAEKMTEYIKSIYGEDVSMTEYDTSHVLFSFTDDSGNALADEAKVELRAKAEGVLARAKAGEDFAALAAEFSADSTATNGGKYTMYDDGNTVDQYTDAVLSMNAGEIYPTLVETTYGYHIIKLNDKIEDGRINNIREREEYVNTLFDEIDVKKNLKINEVLLKAFVLEMNPTAYDVENPTDEY